jgi:hypothetical protein
MAKRVFVSHVGEEAEVAALLKKALKRDFPNLVNVFASSDTESIGAGEDWLVAIERALEECAMMIILCSPTSIDRPWINFEAGMAWMRRVPLVPLCHAGLTPRDLRMPLLLKHGVELGKPDGLRSLYERIAALLECPVPMPKFEDLVKEIARSSATGSGTVPTALGRERAIRKRMTDSLQNPRFLWRSLKMVAKEAAISEDLAADLLRADPEVRFSKDQKLGITVGLRARVG